MSYSLLELPLVLQAVDGTAGDTQINLAANAGPETLVYIFGAMYHDDPTDRACGIYILRGSRPILVTESKLVVGDTGAEAGQGTGLSFIRPAIVIPGDSIRARISALSTGSAITEFNTLHVVIPLGQTLSDYGF